MSHYEGNYFFNIILYLVGKNKIKIIVPSSRKYVMIPHRKQKRPNIIYTKHELIHILYQLILSLKTHETLSPHSRNKLVHKITSLSLPTRVLSVRSRIELSLKPLTESNIKTRKPFL